MNKLKRKLVPIVLSVIISILFFLFYINQARDRELQSVVEELVVKKDSLQTVAEVQKKVIQEKKPDKMKYVFDTIVEVKKVTCYVEKIIKVTDTIFIDQVSHKIIPLDSIKSLLIKDTLCVD